MVVCLGIWGEYALEAFLFLVHGKEHARICLQVAFHYCDLHVAAVYSGRKEGEDVLGLREPAVVVEVLECHGHRLLLIGRVRQPCKVVLAEIHFGGLREDYGLALECRRESVCHAIVVCTECHVESSLHLQDDLVRFSGEFLLAVERRGYVFSDAVLLCGGDTRRCSDNCSVSQSHGDFRLVHYEIPFVSDHVRKVFSGLYLNRDLSVRRCHIVDFWSGFGTDETAEKER